MNSTLTRNEIRIYRNRGYQNLETILYDGELVTVDPQNPPGPGIGFDPSNTNTGEEPFPFEMDGFTVPLEITAPVNPGETNSIKIAIADVGDAVFDSWVIVAAADITTA